jgi:hypothetical protein
MLINSSSLWPFKRGYAVARGIEAETGQLYDFHVAHFSMRGGSTQD